MKSKPILLMVIISLPAAAQEADYELVTTGMHTIRSETALPVTVLAGDELHGAARATIGETLANHPGISNASFGPAVGQTVIRGQQGRRVMNLNNSIANADASGNSADHSVAVEAILADAIEVLRGPSTLLYGGGAIGGVVNVIDNRIPRNLPDSPLIILESRHDTAADQTSSIGRLEFATGSLAWHLDGLRRDWNNLDIPGLAIAPEYLDDEAESTTGHISNTAGKSESATAGVSWLFNSGFLGVAINRLENFYGLPPGALGHEEETEEVESGVHDERVFIDMERTRYDLTGEWRNLTPWLEHVDYRLTMSDYQHVELEGAEFGTRFSNDAWQQRLQLTHTEIGNWHGALGLQSSDEEFGAMGEESFIPVTDITSRGLFLVEDYHGENYTLELGARVNRDDYNPDNGIAPDRNFSTFGASASLLLDLYSSASLGITWSHSERAPSVEELYSNFGLIDADACVIHFATGTCETGDVNLLEEQANNIDLTLYLERGNFNASLTAFYNVFDDYIAQITTGTDVDGLPVRAYRQLDARFSGLELDATFIVNDFVDLQVFGDMVNGNLKDNGDAPRLPPSRLGARLNVDGDNWSAYLSVLHANEQDEPGNFELETESYTRWDLGADFTLQIGRGSELMLFARGRNLGDDEIRLSTSFLRGFAPEAGKSLEVGLRYSY
ncbi:MAG: TonB-dependent receptor [Gammaproteobacteria bacterium]|nr:TonB-dependent receptor [Gammaproteobacteria bacterium]